MIQSQPVSPKHRNIYTYKQHQINSSGWIGIPIYVTYNIYVCMYVHIYIYMHVSLYVCVKEYFIDLRCDGDLGKVEREADGQEIV